jgi:hypothetical protein
VSVSGRAVSVSGVRSASRASRRRAPSWASSAASLLVLPGRPCRARRTPQKTTRHLQRSGNSWHVQSPKAKRPLWCNGAQSRLRLRSVDLEHVDLEDRAPNTERRTRATSRTSRDAVRAAHEYRGWEESGLRGAIESDARPRCGASPSHETARRSPTPRMPIGAAARNSNRNGSGRIARAWVDVRVDAAGRVRRVAPRSRYSAPGNWDPERPALRIPRPFRDGRSDWAPCRSGSDPCGPGARGRAKSGRRRVQSRYA